MEERKRVPHHLIDVTAPDQPWSLAQYRAAAVGLIDEINQRGRLPFLVGGTGQYISAILEGWTIPPGEANTALREKLLMRAQQEGEQVLYQQLQELDPAAAQTIDSRNVRRVIRALEVTLSTGQRYSQQRQKNPPNYYRYTIGLTLDRTALYQRLDARIDKMIQDGLVAEVEVLAAAGYDWALPAMSAIGYKQMGMYLRQELSLLEAIQQIKHHTRTFVRRQANWFKADDPQIHWYDGQTLNLDELTRTLRQFFAVSGDG